MDRIESSAHNLARFARLVVAALGIGLAFELTARSQPKQDEKPFPVATGTEDITFKPIGKPLAIECEGKEIRTLFMFEGRSTSDVRDPARVVYYHGLDLALVPRDKPLSGFPVWVQDVTQRDDDTIVEVRFRLSSPKLRRACEAKLNSDMRDFFDREKARLKVDALKVEVQKVPALELFVAIQDSATKLTIAYDAQHIAQLGEEVKFSFRIKPEALPLFVRCHKEGKLQFKPYYTVRADQIVTAEKQTEVSYRLGMKVKQLLDHRQLAKLKNEDEHTIHPVLQDHVNRIARQVTMDIKSKITASDPTVITFLQNDTMLVNSCFDPANTLSFDSFRKAFPAYTDEMLAEYLKPYGVTKVKANESQAVNGKQHTDEKTKQSGGGFGLSLAIGPLAIGGGGQKQDSERVLDTIYNATGIRLVAGETENFYRAAEVKVYRLAEGYEEKQLAQASSITLSKGALNSYLDESPFPQSYIAEVVDASIGKTLTQNDHVSRLLEKKNQLFAARAASQTKLDGARAAIKGNLASLEATRREICDARISIKENHRELSFYSGKSNGYDSLVGPYHGIQHDYDREEADWSRDRVLRDIVNPQKGQMANQIAGYQKAIETLEQAVAAKTKTLTELFAKSNERVAEIETQQGEIRRLDAEIETLTKEILAILER